MKFFPKAFLTAILLFSALTFACITINIYFPAEKVESVAGEIVNEIRERGDKQKGSSEKETNSLLRETLLAFSCSYAWADEVTSVSNPTIRALKEKMKARYPRMKPYYKKATLKEGDDGYVSLGDTRGLGLKGKRSLKTLVDAENKDRKLLYEEIAKALKIDPTQIDKIAGIFAQEWQKPVK